MIAKTYINDIKLLLAQARQKAYTAINHAMVEVYWQIGRRIVEEELQGEQRATYGEEILQTLSKELTAEFGKGFSYANLKNFKQFYLTYPDEQLATHCVANLTWSHNRLIMRVQNELARQYYLKEATEQQWSVRVLERNINTFYYERLLSSQNKQEAVQHSRTLEKQNPEDFIKDPYILKCFVLFDLKTTKLNHQDVGQMDMYIRMFDDLKRGNDDNPTIGIILCAEKDETIVKYSILKENQRLFAAKYMPYLPTEAELIAEVEREKRLLKEKFEREQV